MRNKAVLVRDVVSGTARLYASCSGAACDMGMSVQTVSKAISRESLMSGRYRLGYVKRFYAVKDRDGKYWLCWYDQAGNKYMSVNGDGFVLEQYAAGVKDVTAGIWDAEDRR